MAEISEKNCYSDLSEEGLYEGCLQLAHRRGDYELEDQMRNAGPGGQGGKASIALKIIGRHADKNEVGVRFRQVPRGPEGRDSMRPNKTVLWMLTN